MQHDRFLCALPALQVSAKQMTLSFSFLSRNADSLNGIGKIFLTAKATVATLSDTLHASTHTLAMPFVRESCGSQDFT
jgi:hypothetical protein